MMTDEILGQVPAGEHLLIITLPGWLNLAGSTLPDVCVISSCATCAQPLHKYRLLGDERKPPDGDLRWRADKVSAPVLMFRL